MPDLTIWWIPDSLTEWCFVARGKRGVCYSLPKRRNGWIVRKRWPDGVAPAWEPLPDAVARVVGGQLGLPGVSKPSAADQTTYGQWSLLARVELMGLDVASARDDQDHGSLRIWDRELNRVYQGVKA